MKRALSRSAGKPRARSAITMRDSLGRDVGFRVPRKTVVVLCEGKVTEPDYIGALKQEPDVRQKASVDIILDPDVSGFSPMTLVQHAAKVRERSKVDGSEIDEIWCVFDVEWAAGGMHHPKLREAIALAADNDVRLAVSNPSFEIWLILHFKDQTAFVDNAAARRIRAACDGSEGKGVNAKLYMDKRDDALKRAITLDRKHAGDQTTFPHNNPSSGMHLFLISVTTALAGENVAE
jgi:hypothetical protein